VHIDLHGVWFLLTTEAYALGSMIKIPIFTLRGFPEAAANANLDAFDRHT
jgi:hypothetical protein